MDRTLASPHQYFPSVRTFGYAPVNVLLYGRQGIAVESQLDAPDRRTVYPHSFLWRTPHDRVAKSAEPLGQSQTGSTTDARHGIGSDLSETPAFATGPASQNIPVFIKKYEGNGRQPGLGGGHHLHSFTWRLYLSHGDHGLVQSLRDRLGTIEFIRNRVLRPRTRTGINGRLPGNIQHRSRLAIYQHGFYRGTGAGRDTHQYGWPRPGNGQYFCGTSLADSEIRGSLLERLSGTGGCPAESEKLFHLLQSGTAAPIITIQNPGRGLWVSRQRMAYNHSGHTRKNGAYKGHRQRDLKPAYMKGRSNFFVLTFPGESHTRDTVSTLSWLKNCPTNGERVK